MPLTNDLSNLASEANAIYNSITANSTAITAISVAGQVINSSGFAVNATFTNTFTIGTSTYFVSNGNVGIGTSTPANRLQISGYSSANQLSDIYISRSSSGNTIQTGPNITFADNVANNTTAIQTTQGRFGIWNYGTGVWVERMSVDGSSGNIGIGTNAPSFGLTVIKDNSSGYTAGFRKDASSPWMAVQTNGTIPNLQGLTSNGATVNNISLQGLGGRIGIGTDTPASDVHILKSGNTVTNLIVQNSGTGTNSAYVASVANSYGTYLQQYGTGEGYVYTTGSSIFVGSSVASPMYFYTNGVSRGIVTAAGDYGVGVLSPATKLDVLGAIRSGGGTDSGTQLVMYSNTSSGDCYIAGYNLTFHTGANNSRIQRMKLDNNGIVTMPYQTAFDAYGSGTQNWTGTAQYLVLQLGAQLSLGSRSTGYNTSTYRFTAPVTGTYAFFCKVTQTTTVTGPEAYIFVNGVAIGHQITIGYSQQYLSASGHLIYQMNAGDYADLRVINNNNVTMTIDLGRSSFSGHLIG